MAEWLTLLGVVGGVASTLFVQWLTQRWAHASAARLAERAEAFEKQKEQKQLARELLLRIERHCSEVAARRSRGAKPPGYADDSLETLREEIEVHSEGLSDSLARRHLARIGTALGWVRDPPWPIHTNPWPIKAAARAVLGAIQRGEAVPQSLPMLDGVLNAQSEWQSELEAQVEAQEEDAKAQREREIRERRHAVAQAPIPPTADSTPNPAPLVRVDEQQQADDAEVTDEKQPAKSDPRGV